MRIHQHHESQKWTRLPANQTCLVCYPVPKPFLEADFGKLPPEVREKIFKDVLTVGSISPLRDGISVPMTRNEQNFSKRGPKTKLSIGPERPASCLALLQTCRQIYRESSLLFYQVNTLYLSGPCKMLSILRHLGPLRCNELQSLHLEDIVETALAFSQRMLDDRRAGEDSSKVDATNAIQLLNKHGKIQKLYIDMRPPQALHYIKLCTQIPGLEHSEIRFASPTRWSVMSPSAIWEKKSWFEAFLLDVIKRPLSSMDTTSSTGYYPYLVANEKYRVEVDILGLKG